MLSTLLISLPANLNIFFRFGLFENMSDGGTTSQKDKSAFLCYLPNILDQMLLGHLHSMFTRALQVVLQDKCLFFRRKILQFPMLFQPLVKATILQWTLEHDVVMRSTERGQIWQNIAATLSSLQQPKSSLTASRAVRDRYTLLTSKQKQKLCAEEKASKIE